MGRSLTLVVFLYASLAARISKASGSMLICDLAFSYTSLYFS